MKPQKALHKYIADQKKTQNYRGHQYMMMPKLDGWYGYIDIGTEPDPIRSNAQRMIPSCGMVSKRVIAKTQELLAGKMLTAGRLVFELTVDGTPQFEKLNGILNRRAICEEIRLNVHDFIPVATPNMWTIERYYMAKQIVSMLEMPDVEMILHKGASSVPEEWEAKAVQLIDSGEEGLILKKLEAAYSPGKRNEDLMKIKEECEFDLLCVGMERGSVDGKYANSLGALVLQDKKGSKFLVSGMTDKQRSDWWGTPSMIIKKVVKIKAKNVMQDGSLREPRFNVIRYDKIASEIDSIAPKRKTDV